MSPALLHWRLAMQQQAKPKHTPYKARTHPGGCVTSRRFFDIDQRRPGHTTILSQR